jgi:hypothetical protein
MPILKTPMFNDAINQARATIQNQNDVFAVFRINSKEDSIGFVNSAQFSRTDATKGIVMLEGGLEVTTFNAKNAAKRRPTDVIADGAIVPGNKVAVVNDRQENGHAEEMFLRALPALGQRDGHLTCVELYLSRIPCMDQSPEWLYTIGGGRIQPYHQLPAGCGPKLYKIIKDEIPCTWIIEWEQEYPNANTQSKCAAQMQMIDQLPNASARKI